MESWKLFKDFKELDLSLTDCTSIRLAKKQGIHKFFLSTKNLMPSDSVGSHSDEVKGEPRDVNPAT
jgi:hypothetical protein